MPDNRFTKPLLGNSGVFAHSEDGRKRETIFTRNKAAELLSQDGRQHGNGALNKVYTRRTFACVTVQRGVGLYEI
jgi:hypothetical protein